MDKRPLRTTRRLSNLQRAGWFKVKNLATGPVQVTVYDEIGMFGVSAQDFVNELGGIAGDIEMHLNSPGGDVFDGIAIYNALRQRPGTVSVVVDGIAASAASFIAQAASPGQLAMAPHSQMMIHDGFGMAIGNAADMREMADLLDKASDNIAGIYADRTGQPAAQWRDKMRNETWYSDQEAVDAGLADKILGQDPPVRDSWDLSVYDHWNAAAPYEPAPYRRDQDEDVQCPNCQKYNDSDAHFCDQCGRKLPASAFDATGGQKPYSRQPDETVQCPECHRFNDPDAQYCDQCGEHLAGRTDVQVDGGTGNSARPDIFMADKYKQADRDRMAKSGEAMPDGSYPIADAEDLDNAIHAVGRGGADHDAIRAHIIKRADALGLSSHIPDNWNADGSLKDAPGNLSDAEIWAALADPALFQLDAGKEVKLWLGRSSSRPAQPSWRRC